MISNVSLSTKIAWFCNLLFLKSLLPLPMKDTLLWTSIRGICTFAMCHCLRKKHGPWHERFAQGFRFYHWIMCLYAIFLSSLSLRVVIGKCSENTFHIVVLEIKLYFQMINIYCKYSINIIFFPILSTHWKDIAI